MTQTRYYYSEECGNLFEVPHSGIAITAECPNCTQPAHEVPKSEYDNLLEQKINI